MRKFLIFFVAIIFLLSVLPSNGYANPTIKILKTDPAKKIMIGIMQKSGVKMATKENYEKAVEKFNRDLWENAGYWEDKKHLVEEINNAEIEPYPDNHPKKGFGRVVLSAAAFLTGVDVVFDLYNAFKEAYELHKAIELLEEPLPNGVYKSINGFYILPDDDEDILMNQWWIVGNGYQELIKASWSNYLYYEYPNGIKAYPTTSYGKDYMVIESWLIRNGETKMKRAGSRDLYIPMDEWNSFDNVAIKEEYITSNVGEITSPEWLQSYVLNPSDQAKEQILNSYPNGIEIDVPLAPLEDAPDPETQPWTDPLPETLPQPNPSPDPQPEPSPDPLPNPSPDPSPDPQPEPSPDPLPNPSPDPSPDPQPEPSPDPSPNPSPDPSPEPRINWEPLITGGGMITTKFPFSIPWDVFRLIKMLDVEPICPRFDLDASKDAFYLGSVKIPFNFGFDIDFCIFEPIAEIFRWGLLIVFDICIVLALRRLTPD